MGQIFDHHMEVRPNGILPPDQISYILAKIINFCFADSAEISTSLERMECWRSLDQRLQQWLASLPTSYAPFSNSTKEDNPFPSLWMLQPCHSAYVCVFRMFASTYGHYSSSTAVSSGCKDATRIIRAVSEGGPIESA